MSSPDTESPAVAEQHQIESVDPVAGEIDALATSQFSGGRGGYREVLVRSLVMLGTLLIVSLVVFAATQILPGDAASHILGKNATPEALARLRAQLHLNRPAVVQYWDWISGVLQGNLGVSVSARVPVTTLIGSRIANTAVLVLIAAGVTLPVAVLFGLVGAVRRDKAVDHVLAAFAIVFTAVPDFVVGMVLVIVFATSVLRLFPAVSLIPQGASPLRYLNEFILPAATLVLVSVPYLGRLLRASMIDVLQSEYVLWARLKGMPERTVILRHALPNALVPLVQGTALILAYMSGGIVVIEYLFAFPGLGSSLLQAVQDRDIPVIQAVCLMFAAFYVVVNIAADVLSVILTPRLRKRAAA
jgi:peptide/nickel transport system permease protein